MTILKKLSGEKIKLLSRIRLTTSKKKVSKKGLFPYNKTTFP